MSTNLLAVRMIPVHCHPMVTLKKVTLTLFRPLCLSSQCMAGYSNASGHQQKEEPVKYTTSKAHTYWKAYMNWRDPNFYDHTPKSQRLVVQLSVAAVLIYFCLLREENDIDEIIYQPLIKTRPQLEEPLIVASIAEHKRHGKPSADLEKRLKEIKGEVVTK